MTDENLQTRRLYTGMLREEMLDEQTALRANAATHKVQADRVPLTGLFIPLLLTGFILDLLVAVQFFTLQRYPAAIGFTAFALLMLATAVYLKRRR